VKQIFTGPNVTLTRRVKIFVEMRARCALFNGIPLLPSVSAIVLFSCPPAAVRRAP
jgi:hypothetical protein